MSDEAPGSGSSPEQSIPKTRFDEVVAERNRQAQETQFLRQTLDQLMANQRQQQAQVPAAEDPDMARIKEENPALYKRIMKSEQDNKQLRAGFSTLADNQDRMLFLQSSGEGGKKRLAEVEQILQQQRAQGNFRADRAGIYTWLLGQDQLKASMAPKPAPAAAPQETPTDAPGSDPRQATTVSGGTAPANKVAKTREERIAELKDIEF